MSGTIATGTLPFDRAAATYDRDWSADPAGAAQRRAVHRHLAAVIAGLDRRETAVDLGCGIGDDAEFLASHGLRVVGVDSSTAMIEAARRNLPAGTFLAAPIESVTSAELGLAPASVDLVVSNFSPLNCVADLPAPFALAAELLRPGGRFVVVLFGTLPIVEISLALARLDLRRALRRRRFRTVANVAGAPLPITYWCSSHVKRAAGASFRLRGRRGIGLVVPPSGIAAPKPLVGVAESIDRAASPLLPSFADHVLYDLERV